MGKTPTLTSNSSLLNNDLHLHEIGDLTPLQKRELDGMVNRYRAIAATEHKLGFTALEEHIIDTGNSEPVKQKCYPNPHHHREYVKKEIDSVFKLALLREPHLRGIAPYYNYQKPMVN